MVLKEYRKTEFFFTRNGEEYDDAEYQSFADKLEQAARFVTDNFHAADDWCKKSGIYITNADCTDYMPAWAERFENVDGLLRLLRDSSFNGWEYVDGYTLTVTVCSRNETNFYIRTDGECEEDGLYVAQVIFDDPNYECLVEQPKEKKTTKKTKKSSKK